MTERVWVQPAHLIVREGHLRWLYGIPDDQPLPDGQPLQDMVAQALYSDPWNLELDEDWREDDPEPIQPSGRCACGHWLEASPGLGRGGHPERRYRTGGHGDRCSACACTTPTPEPPPPWAGPAL
jgi:hypothetical protein